MRQFRRSSYLILVTLALLGGGVAHAQSVRKVPIRGPAYIQRGPHGMAIIHPREAVADRVLVGLNPTVSALAVDHGAALAAQGGGQLRKSLARGRVMVVDLPAGSDVVAAAARFSRLPGVTFAEPDGFVYPTMVPNDPGYNQQYYLPLMQAPAAWDVTTGSSSTLIAFIDSGVDLDHPDLASKIWNNPHPYSDASYPDDIHGWSFVDNSNNVEPVPVVGGDNSIVAHGTLTAGIAAGLGNDAYGVAGVNWQAKIMECKVFAHDGSGATNAMVVEAMDYAVAHGAKVINMSLGGPWATVYTAAVQAAYQAGVVVVVAAGNSYTALTDTYKESPVCNDGPNPGDNMALGVAATDQNDRKADFSNWDQSTARTYVDVAAPGVAIYGDFFYDGSAEFNAYFGSNNGTSFSTPMVSGLAALIFALHPSYTPAQVIAAIRGNADNIDALNSGYAGMLGGGRVNMARSLGVISPPQPVHNLQATNTPSSQGGSITLTWLTSADDGAGANNVTQYSILRRQGTTGSFASVGTAPPGSQTYADTTTTDGVPYYYEVQTYAGTLFSTSSVAGPVQSSDDLPPPQVTTLSAEDRPADSGGAIVLTWTYTPPADFAAYHVYRDAFAFTTVTGRTPLATITNKTAVTYTDASTSDGVDYYYALTAVDASGNENPTVIPVGPVKSFPNQNVNFSAGVQLLATPVLPPDGHPATLFGLPTAGLKYARYDTVSGKYIYYTSEPLPTNLKVTLGTGFWMNLAQAATVAPAGQAAPAGDFPASVLAGWDLLGNPFFAAFDFSTCTVTSGSSTLDLYSAQAAGLINSAAWIWDPALKGYRLINGGTIGSMIAPWQGFWVRGLAACTLNLTRPLAASAAGVAAASARPLSLSAAAVRARPVVAWRLQLTAEAGGCSDLDNYCGVASVAQQVESPPLPGQGVELALGYDSAGPVALKYYPPGTGTITQPLSVSWSGLTGSVRVAWPEVNTIPGNHTFLLQDLATGQVVNLRETPEYVFQATQATGQRAFSLTITPASTDALTVNALSAQPANSGAQLVFVLSKSANCDIKILNIAGRVVRQVLMGALQPAGQSTILWDGRSQLGVRVPNGRYLVSLEARDDQGNVARVVSDLALVR